MPYAGDWRELKWSRVLLPGNTLHTVRSNAMSGNVSVQQSLANLLAWERSSTSHTDQFGSECILPGPVDGFVDRAAAYLTVLRELGEADFVVDRAKQFESMTAPESALDEARKAIQPIVEAIANAKEGWSGGREWEVSRPRTNGDFISRRRRTPHVIPQDVTSTIAQLGISLDCVRWNPSESHRCVRKLLTYSLEPPLPNREGLERLVTSMSELWLNSEQDASWGCWLLIQCHHAVKQSPPTFAQLIQKLDDSHIEAIKAAARFTANSERAGTETTPTLDAKDRKRLLKVKEEIDRAGDYVGSSDAILKMFERIHSLNKSSYKPVLILGPSGAGKSDLAKLVHAHSGRKGTFDVEQATGVMNSDFGIVQARWEGYAANSGLANADPEGQPGLLDHCSGGTIFVDELHACTKEFQTFLLKIIDETANSATNPLEGTGKTKARNKVAKLGPPVAHQSVKRDVRLIFASSRELGALEEMMIPDLIRRLKPWIVEVPPLRIRKDDIPSFVTKMCGDKEPDERFLLALLRYDWPGQAGELVDSLLKAVGIAGEEKRLKLEHLELRGSTIVEEIKNLDENNVNRELYKNLATTLKRQGFRKPGILKRLVSILPVSEATVRRKMKEYLADFDYS